VFSLVPRCQGLTDQEIRVHALYCVLALMAARLMARETERAKLTMSVREVLSQLGGIQETVLLYQGERGPPRVRRMLGLEEYAPKR